MRARHRSRASGHIASHKACHEASTPSDLNLGLGAQEAAQNSGHKAYHEAGISSVLIGGYAHKREELGMSQSRNIMEFNKQVTSQVKRHVTRHVYRQI